MVNDSELVMAFYTQSVNQGAVTLLIGTEIRYNFFDIIWHRIVKKIGD